MLLNTNLALMFLFTYLNLVAQLLSLFRKWFKAKDIMDYLNVNPYHILLFNTIYCSLALWIY